MSPAEQKRIVRELLDGIEERILNAIDTHAIPEEWDGIELREMVFDLAAECRAFNHRKGLRHHSGKRALLYRNHMLTHNI